MRTEIVIALRKVYTKIAGSGKMWYNGSNSSEPPRIVFESPLKPNEKNKIIKKSSNAQKRPVRTRAVRKTVTKSPTPNMSKHSPHMSIRVSEMLIVLAVVILLATFGVFVAKTFDIGDGLNNYYVNSQPSASVMADHIADQQEFQQVDAPAGLVVSGFPSSLIPIGATIISSYHNRYNGYDQYTTNLIVTQPIASVYTAMQKLLSKASFALTQKSTTDAVDTLNAKQGMDYVTVQITPNGKSAVALTIVYGMPIK